MPDLASKEICTGCTACMNICPKHCIEMKADLDGFAYPDIKDISACIKCGKCELICPVKNLKENINLPMAYAALSKEDELRIKSSSGGVFSELAKRIIAQNGVVYGAEYDDAFKVKHSRIENEDDLWRLRGAKYSESKLGSVFTDVLSDIKQGKLVLFSGTPCQIAGFKAYLNKDYDNLYCVDFVCHGVPSPMVWNAYVEYRAKADAHGKIPTAINMRSKCSGWSKYKYSNVFQYENGVECTISNAESLFMGLFIGDYISRQSCENCKFKGYGRVSDITIGDFWGIWDIAPEMDDDKGTSVVLVQSEKGQALWSEISKNLILKEVSLEQASQQNSSILTPSKANPERNVVLDRIRKGQIGACEDLFVSPKPSIISRIKRKVKRLIKSLISRRILKIR